MRLAADNRVIVATWIVTRGIMAFVIWWFARDDVFRLQDVNYYLDVAEHLRDTRTMPDTEMWQYPPGATVVLLLPLLAGAAYYAAAFVAFMAIVDAAITFLLARFARRTGVVLGVWAWLLGVPAMREYPFLRFDLVPTLFAVAALTWAIRRPAVFGALAGLGAFIKAWPIVVLAAEWRPRRMLLAALVAAVVFVAGVQVAGQVFGDQGRALDNQAERGLQNEALAATPWHVQGIVDGDGAPLVYGSGATEIDDPRAREVADALRWLTLAVGVLLAAWWSARTVLLRRDPDRRDWLASPAAGADLVTVGVLLAIVTSRVLSPQFMIWLLAVSAISLSFRDTRLRGPLVFVALATACTLKVLHFPEVLVLRNVLLAIAAVYASVVLVGGLRARDDVERPVTDLLDPEPSASRDAQHVRDVRTLA
jgi:hypothetical protein